MLLKSQGHEAKVLTEVEELQAIVSYQSDRIGDLEKMVEYWKVKAMPSFAYFSQEDSV